MDETINLSAVLDQVCAEKNISREALIETVEQAVSTAAKKVFEDRDIEATFDAETGHVNLFHVLYVVERVENPSPRDQPRAGPTRRDRGGDRR
jgi:N utilization substance protein A